MCNRQYDNLGRVIYESDGSFWQTYEYHELSTKVKHTKDSLGNELWFNKIGNIVKYGDNKVDPF